MATDALAQARLETLKQQQRGLVTGLVWGFLALALLAGWLYAKDWEEGFPAVIGTAVLALIMLVLAIWQFRLGRRAGPGPAEAETMLRGGRRMLARALFAVAGILLALLIWLAIQRGFTMALPELSSGVILAIIGLGAGTFLFAEPGARLNQDQVLQQLAARRQPLMVGLFVVGGISVAACLVVTFTTGVSTAFPEAVGAGLVGLVAVWAALWLLVNAATPLTPTRLRILTLTVGGLVGLIIAVMTIIRAVMWWNDVFAGGLRTWQGEGSWRLWVCFYVELLGLVILYASLLLAYPDIRVNVLLRRLLFGYNAVLTGLLLLAILVVINVTVYAYYPYTFEWTKTRGLYSLSPKSKHLLENLKEPVTIYVLMSAGAESYRDVRTLLQNVQIYTNRVQVEYISPDLQVDRFRKLMQRFPKLAQERNPMERGGARGLLVVYGPDTGEVNKPPPNAFIPAGSLTETRPVGRNEPGEPPKVFREFKGEDLLMTELRTLARGGEQSVIYFTQGHGELDIRDNEPGTINGAGLFVELLKKKRYQVRGLVWGPPPKKGGDPLLSYSQKGPESPHEVPRDATTLIIAQPQLPYEKDVLATLEKYAESKGRLMVLSNIKVQPNTFTRVETGLEALLKKYGVELGNDFILTYRGRLPEVSVAVPPRRSTNEIARAFQNTTQFYVQMARTVKPLTGQGAYHAQTILEVRSPPNPPVFWAEKDLQNLRNLDGYLRSLTRDQIEDLRSTEPLPVGVAVSDKDRPMLVVYGDALMISNDVRFPQIRYFDLMASSLEWLAGRPENIGIEPRKDSFFRFHSPTIHFGRMVFLPTGLILLSLLGVGAGVWVVRRR
jgi:hypothetical protein